MSNNTDIKLSDNSIALIAKALQVAMLTGTDVVDNLRMMSFELNENVLNPTAGYAENFDKNINSMVKEVMEVMNSIPVEDEDDEDEPFEKTPQYVSALDGSGETDWPSDDDDLGPDDEVDVDNW